MAEGFNQPARSRRYLSLLSNIDAPFACGGPDVVSNLQWQTVAATKAKDRWELRACAIK
jgi:hypothetical protein